MSRSLFVALGLALVLTGCAETPAYREFGVRTTNEAHASVQVVADKFIIVSQEPIFVQQEEDNTIFWHLPHGGAYFFSSTNQNPGIQFDNPQMPRTDCKIKTDDKWTYVCTYKKANRAKYPYNIRVTKNGTDILKSDPTVMNN